MFHKPALNTLSKESAEITKKTKDIFLFAKTKVKTISLKEVLDNHFNQKNDIDFLSVDALEG